MIDKDKIGLKEVLAIDGEIVYSDLKTIYSLVQLSDERQQQHLRLFSRISIEERCQIIEKQKKIFHKLNETRQYDKTMLSYCSLIIAIDQFANNHDNVQLKAKVFINKTRKTKKSEILSTYLSIILKLKDEENYTFRMISEYLKSFYKFEISHSAIYKFYTKIKGENNVK